MQIDYSKCFDKPELTFGDLEPGTVFRIDNDPTLYMKLELALISNNAAELDRGYVRKIENNQIVHIINGRFVIDP